MLTVETIGRIRREHFLKGKTIKEIARDLKVSRNAVRRVLRSGATSFEYEREVQPRPKLGRWTAELDEGRRALTDAEIQSGLSSFYYDLTASTSAPSLAPLKKFISPTRLLMGFDFLMMPTTTIAPAQDQLAANGDFHD